MNKMVLGARVGICILWLITGVVGHRALAGDLQWYDQTWPAGCSMNAENGFDGDGAPSEILADVTSPAIASTTQSASPDVVSTYRPTTQ